MLRIGELLQRDGLVTPADLASALADQAVIGKRLCSLLVLRGVIDPDQAARALAEQHGVSAALMKHLDNRDRALAKLLPANIARAHCALPIGRLRDGEIVICVRDPKPHQQAAFERILGKPVLITVACAHVLEPLIDAAYAPAVTQDFGVRVPLGPMNEPPPPPVAFATGTESNGVVEDEVDVDLDTGPLPTDPDLAFEALALVDLDDASVSKDFSQFDLRTPTALPPGAGAPPRATTLPPPNVTRPPAKK